MNFIDYCLHTKNYSAIKNVKEYVKQFALDEDTNRTRTKIVVGALAGGGLAYGLGRSGGRSDAESDFNNQLNNYVSKNGKISSVDDVAKFMKHKDDYSSGEYDPDDEYDEDAE